MGLTTYRKKRNFKSTSEPKGKKSGGDERSIFIVHRHKASHLHYDFRIEIGGTLKSWAVPKGPSMNPTDKRLAMMVEDHPYDYKDFKGIIPEGNYGAGIVEIWDKGYFTMKGADTKSALDREGRKAIKAGNLKITLHGRKLKGEFALVRLRDIKGTSWLLIKHADKFSTEKEYSSETYTPLNSPINKWLKKHRKRNQPARK